VLETIIVFLVQTNKVIWILSQLNEECVSKLQQILLPEASEPVSSELLVKIVCVCALCCFHLQAIGRKRRNSSLLDTKIICYSGSKQAVSARLFLLSIFGTLSSTLVSASAPPEALKRRKKIRMRRRVNQLLPESDESEGNWDQNC